MSRLLLASALALAFAAGTSRAGADDASIDRITGALRPKFYLTGQPVVSYRLAERMKELRVPAVSIALIDGYRVAWARAYGLADVANQTPAVPATLFQAASMSKPVFAAAALALFERRGLDVDADIDPLLVAWHLPAPAAGVTLRRLLSHSAGVNVSGFVGYDRDAELPTLLDVLDGKPPANSPAIRVTGVPGAEADYSGGGTTIAQQLVVDLTHEPFAEFMRRSLLAPLGMSDSTFSQPLSQTLWPRAADGYHVDGAPVHRGWHVYPTMAAAGLWTTPTDLAKFVIAIQNALRRAASGPLDPRVARAMTTTVAEPFGAGLEVHTGYFTHNGANEGYQGVFFGLNDGGRGIAIMTNSDNGIRLASEIVHAAAAAYGWPVLAPVARTPVALGPAALAGLAGSYGAHFDTDVTLDVRVAGDSLVLGNSMDGSENALYAESPTRFFTLDGGSLEFTLGPDGKARSISAIGATFTRKP